MVESSRSELLDTITQERTVVALIVLQAISGNVELLQLFSLPIEVTKLVESWIFGGELAIGIAVFSLQHHGVSGGQRILMLRVEELV